MHNLTEEQLAAIQEILLKCGEQARDLGAQPFQVFEKGINDYVTSVDQALDEQLLKAFQDLFPEDGIITEENLKSKQSYGQNCDRFWLIDPIDGTEEFMQQGSGYAVMVGLLVHGQPTAGWIYAPAARHLYWGGQDWGLFEQRAHQSATPLTPSLPPALKDNVCPIMIGDKDQRRFGAAIAHEIPTVQFATSGSFGLKVLEVIKGQVGLYLYLNGRVKLWDTTGPIAMAKAAGLVCCDLEGNPLQFHADAIDPTTLTHRQSILVGWPDYVEALLPAIKRAVASVRSAESQLLSSAP